MEVRGQPGDGRRRVGKEIGSGGGVEVEERKLKYLFRQVRVENIGRPRLRLVCIDSAADFKDPF
jgi:hypothetical protein